MIQQPVELQALTPASLDDLWTEAETLGILRVRTKTDLYDKVKRGYTVTIIGHRRSTKMEIEKSIHRCTARLLTLSMRLGKWGWGSQDELR